MSKNHQLYRFGDIVHLQRGHNPPKSEFVYSPTEGYVRFYQIRDGWSDQYKVYVPDTKKLHRVSPDEILMVAYRHIGRAFRGVSGAFNVALCKITNARKDILDDDYLFQLIQSSFIKGELLKRSERSLIPSMSVKHLKSLKVPLPPLEEQQRIVAVLDEALAGVQTALDHAQRNLQNAQELFDSYLQSIFENPSDDWTTCTIDSCINFIDYRGKTPKKTEEGLRLITAKNVKKGFLQRTPEEFVNPNTYDTWMTRGIPNKGDVLFTTEAPLGNVAQLDTDEKVVLAQRIITMQPDAKKLDQTFLKYLLLSSPIQQRILDKGTGATVKGIKSKLLKKIEIYFPRQLESQQEIVTQLDALSAKTQQLQAIYQQKQTALQELKQSILQQAFSGHL